MGTWSVDITSEPGILRLTLAGTITVPEITAMVEAHNRAIDALTPRDYKVWVDLTAMEPLSPEAAMLFEQAKRYSNAHPNFRGSSVLVKSGTVSLQHRLTSIRSGVMNTERIDDNEAVLREHLRTVWRSSS